MALSYQMPPGTALGPNQVWNAQHGYVSTEAKHCDKESLVAAYNAAGRPAMRTWIKGQAAKGVSIPSYPTCMAWFKRDDDGAEAAPAVVHQSIANTTITTLDDVEASYKKSIEALITNLEDKEVQLKVEIDKVINDLAMARARLTKFD